MEWKGAEVKLPPSLCAIMLIGTGPSPAEAGMAGKGRMKVKTDSHAIQLDEKRVHGEQYFLVLLPLLIMFSPMCILSVANRIAKCSNKVMPHIFAAFSHDRETPKGPARYLRGWKKMKDKGKSYPGVEREREREREREAKTTPKMFWRAMYSTMCGYSPITFLPALCTVKIFRMIRSYRRMSTLQKYLMPTPYSTVLAFGKYSKESLAL